MRNLDFTPEWYIRQVAERASGRVQISGLAVIVLLLLAWVYDATHRARAATAEHARLQTVYDVQDPVVQRMQALEAEQAEHDADAELVRMLRGGVPAAELIAELSHLMPPTMSLRLLMYDGVTRVPPTPAAEGQEQPDPATRETAVLALVGMAAAGRDVGNFITELTASPLFSSVTLEYERSETFNERRVVAFRIVCRMPEFE